VASATQYFNVRFTEFYTQLFGPRTDFISLLIFLLLMSRESGVARTQRWGSKVDGVNASSKLGRRSVEGVRCGDGVFLPFPPGKGSGEGQFLFGDLEMAYFGELYEVLNLKFLQRVSIACYAERCISHDRFCPTV